MDATRKLYILLELDSIGYTLLPQIKKCIDDGAILDKESYNYQLPPLWYAIYTHCSPEVVKMLYDAHYDPSYNKKMMCFIDTLDNDDIDDYIKIDMTLKTFIRYLAGLLQRKRASITLLRQYWKIIGAKCKLTPKTKHGAINIY